MREVLFQLQDPPSGLKVTWSGPRHPPALAGLPEDYAAVDGLLLVSGDGVDVSVASEAGLDTRQQGEEGPALFEETTYQVVVEGPSGVSLGLKQRHPWMTSDVIQVGQHSNLLSGTLNFRRQVGRANFSVAVNGRVALSFTVEVFPLKVDYRSDYVEMRADIDAAVRGLAFEYLRATSGGASVSAEPQRWATEWLALLRTEVDSLARAMEHIEQYPRRQLDQTIERVRLDKVRRSSRTLRKALREGRGRGPIRQLKSGRKAREVVPTRRTRETLDTPEHRWLKSGLSQAVDKLRVIRRELVQQLTNLEQVGRSSVLVEAQLSEVDSFMRILRRLSSLSVLRSAGSSSPLSLSSLTLTQAVGYREAHSALRRLRMSLSVESDHLDMAYKDIDELYQVWCFISVAEQVRTLLGATAVSGSIFEATESGLRISLRSGRTRAVSLDLPDGTTVTLRAEPYFSGLTGGQKPDIVMAIEQPDWPELYIILDAKYRVVASRQYVTQFGGPGPPVGAINAIHRYRDAIVIGDRPSSFGRPVVRGAALFPYPDDKGSFNSHSFRQALDVLGIGALPYLPSNRTYVDTWLESLLTEPIESLAEPGPPYLGLTHKNQ